MTTEHDIFKTIFPPNGDVPAAYMRRPRWDRLAKIQEHVTAIVGLIGKPHQEKARKFIGTKTESEALNSKIVSLRDSGLSWVQISRELQGVISPKAMSERYKYYTKKHPAATPPPKAPPSPEPPSAPIEVPAPAQSPPSPFSIKQEKEILALHRKGETLQTIARSIGAAERYIMGFLMQASSSRKYRVELDKLIWDWSKEGLTPLSISELLQDEYGLSITPKTIENRLNAQRPVSGKEAA
jgi:hypothetical protein